MEIILSQNNVLSTIPMKRSNFLLWWRFSMFFIDFRFCQPSHKSPFHEIHSFSSKVFRERAQKLNEEVKNAPLNHHVSQYPRWNWWLQQLIPAIKDAKMRFKCICVWHISRCICALKNQNCDVCNRVFYYRPGTECSSLTFQNSSIECKIRVWVVDLSWLHSSLTHWCYWNCEFTNNGCGWHCQRNQFSANVGNSSWNDL